MIKRARCGLGNNIHNDSTLGSAVELKSSVLDWIFCLEVLMAFSAHSHNKRLAEISVADRYLGG